MRSTSVLDGRLRSEKVLFLAQLVALFASSFADDERRVKNGDYHAKCINRFTTVSVHKAQTH